MDARREETDCVRRAASCASFLPLNPRPPPPVARRSSLSAPSRPTARQFIVDVWGGARPVCRRDPPASPSISPPPSLPASGQLPLPEKITAADNFLLIYIIVCPNSYLFYFSFYLVTSCVQLTLKKQANMSYVMASAPW